MGVIEVHCGWCKKKIGETIVKDDDPNAGSISHGICEKCREDNFSGIPRHGDGKLH